MFRGGGEVVDRVVLIRVWRKGEVEVSTEVRRFWSGEGGGGGREEMRREMRVLLEAPEGGEGGERGGGERGEGRRGGEETWSFV